MSGAIDKIKPSIVIVGTYNTMASPRFTLRGTGFVVGNGNWVVTNVHALPDRSPAADDASGTRLVIQARA